MNLSQIKVEYVISFSDAVFAFSITFMALSIQLPNFPSGIEESEIARRLIQTLLPSIIHVPLIKGDNVMVSYSGGRLSFQVISVAPQSDSVLVTQKTAFHIAEKGQAARGITHVYQLANVL